MGETKRHAQGGPEGQTLWQATPKSEIPHPELFRPNSPPGPMYHSDETGLVPAPTCACTCGVTALDLQKQNPVRSLALMLPLPNGMCCAEDGDLLSHPRSSGLSIGSLAQDTPKDPTLATHSLNQVSGTGQAQAHLVHGWHPCHQASMGSTSLFHSPQSS